jgi:hypothetical protein
MSGAYEKFPRLKYILTESGCAWVAPMLKQLDRIHMGFKAGAIGEMNYEGMEWVLKDSPSEYAARNCYYGASFPSLQDLEGIDAVGEDHVHLSVQPGVSAPDLRRYSGEPTSQNSWIERR